MYSTRCSQCTQTNIFNFFQIEIFSVYMITEPFPIIVVIEVILSNCEVIICICLIPDIEYVGESYIRKFSYVVNLTKQV